MKEIQLTQGKVALVDDEDFERVNQYKWHAVVKDNARCYALRMVRRPGDYGRADAFPMAGFVMGVPRGVVIDHRSGNTLDNRRKNLRVATVSQNAANRRARNRCSRVGFKGVYASRLRFRATIVVMGRHANLGTFDDADSAARAYDAAAVKHFGEFALTNEV